MNLDDQVPLSASVGYGCLGLRGELGYEGKGITVKGRAFPHAISAHGPSSIRFAVPPGVSRLHCHVAINGDVAPHVRTHANFHVMADGTQLALEAWVRPGEAPRQIDVKVEGAHEIELRVTTTRWEHCHAVWLDPVLDCAPVAQPQSALRSCLGLADIPLSWPMRGAQRCIATVVSPGFEAMLGGMLRSLRSYGGCEDAMLAVLAVDGNARISEVAEQNGALVIPCTSRGRIDVGIKSLLYSVARVIDAEQFLCLDADTLVVGDLSPLFTALEAAPRGAVLACREGNHIGRSSLGAAMESTYFGARSDLSRLCPGEEQRVAAYPLVVNDGVFAGHRDAMLALDGTIRALSGAAEWVVQRRHVCWWRNQFVFNLGLALLDCGSEFDASYNVQLHTGDAQRDDGAIARFRGKRARVLHFCGVGRNKYPAWLAALDSLDARAPSSATGAHEPVEAPPERRSDPLVASTLSVQPSAPLVSCIMPTRDRPDYVVQAIRYFERQDHPNRELIIVDDSAGDWSVRRTRAERVRVIPISRGASIGAKRNLACEHARGDIIAHWDDDDWYAPARLSTQIASIVSGESDVVGLQGGTYFDVAGWRFWCVSPDLHKRMFVHDVHGGTLVYRRSIWTRGARYPDRSLAEDAAFLRQAIRGGARLRRLANDDLFIYLRHAGNSWSFECGVFLDPRGWREISEPEALAGDRSFYAERSWARRTTDAAPPLVSCIMPTFNRRSFVPLAIRYFERQDYPNAELIVIDDGDDPVDDLVPTRANVRYARLARRSTVGAKRNVACEAAKGDLIAHWDDDDWHAADRLTYQVGCLTASSELCGIQQMLFYEPGARRAWKYGHGAGMRRPWLSGSTLMYRRGLWERLRFDDVSIGEDARFVGSCNAKSIEVLRRIDFHVGIIHAANVSPKTTRGASWTSISADSIQRLMGEDAALYAEQVARRA